jgi:hypothetical protein
LFSRAQILVHLVTIINIKSFVRWFKRASSLRNTLGWPLHSENICPIETHFFNQLSLSVFDRHSFCQIIVNHRLVEVYLIAKHMTLVKNWVSVRIRSLLERACRLVWFFNYLIASLDFCQMGFKFVCQL